MVIIKKDAKQNENTVYYFKKEYSIKECKKSIINIFAETRYKLYINGRLAGVGPCKPSSEIKYYDELDISEYIKQGENTFEAVVLQLAGKQYSDNYLFLESVIRNGGMCLSIWGNAGDAEIITDESWLAAKEEGLEFFYKPEYNAYNAAAICEKVSHLYRKPVFENAVCVSSLYDMEDKNNYSTELVNPFKKRTIPMMFFKNKDFIKLKKNIFDAGELTCGYIRLKCSGKGILRLTYAECFAVRIDKEVRMIKNRRDDESGIIIGDYDIIEIDGECFYEPFWMRTFRYIKADIEGNVKIEKLDYIETGYPIEISDAYDFGNDKDNKLFEISVNTLRRCMHETYVDCPYYEQLQYTMDTHLQILFTYQLSQDKRLAEKAIDDFAQSYRAGWLTQSRYPVNKAQYIPGFSLFFILMLYEHFKRFGNKEFIKQYLPVAHGIIDWFVKRLDGYMVSRSNLWDFIDWAEEYDKETGRIPSKKPIGVYSLMLSYALEKLSEMHDILGYNTENYTVLSDKIKKDVKTRCFDSKKGLYADSPEKTHFAQHTQIWAVLCETERGDEAKKLLKKAMNLKCKASLAYTFFLFRAFEQADMYEIVNEYMDSFRGLIELGCTTTPERLGEDVRSECHAWSAVAIYEFTAKVLGVTYKDSCINIKPYVKDRNFAKGEVATPEGMVYVEWEINDGKFTIKIKLPENTKSILTMPDGMTLNAENGIYSCKMNT